MTGLAELGGDWDLEFSIGTIDSEFAFTHQFVEYWHGTLDLTALESEVLVNGSTASNQFVNAETGGTIAMDSSGRYVVTWFDNRSGNDDVYARVYNADGTARTAEFMVHGSNSSAQDWCSVSMADNGNFVITWSDNRSGNYEVYMRLFNVDGTALTAETMVSSRTGIQDYHAVDMASDGSFVVAFLDQNVNDVYFQRYNSSGVAQALTRSHIRPRPIRKTGLTLRSTTTVRSSLPGPVKIRIPQQVWGSMQGPSMPQVLQPAAKF